MVRVTTSFYRLPVLAVVVRVYVIYRLSPTPPGAPVMSLRSNRACFSPDLYVRGDRLAGGLTIGHLFPIEGRNLSHFRGVIAKVLH